MPKFDRVEYDKRIRSVQDWIIEDWPYGDIVDLIVSQWSLSERQAKRYIKKARAKWNEVEDIMIDHKRRLKIESLKKLKKSLLEKYKGTPHGIRSILQVEKEIIKLENLDHPKKREITGKNGGPIEAEFKMPESNVDYTKLPDDVLKQIVGARIKPAI